MDLNHLRDLGQRVYEDGPGALIAAIVGAIGGLQIPTESAECGGTRTFSMVGTELHPACIAPNHARTQLS